MDFSYLLEIAKHNSDEAGKKASVKRYSTDLKPAKKEMKGNVKSGAIKAFLARREEEEKQKEIDAQHKKCELLSLRSQNTKSTKRAKLMTSRTKDNDYSKIKLSDEEEQQRKQRETELQRRMLTDKIERMKARIELEEKEKLLPRKRKRKAQLKNEIPSEKSNSHHEDNLSDNEVNEVVIADQIETQPKRKVPPSTASPFNFHDLLKLASKKQHEPIPAPKVVKKEERPMTEKEKRLYEEQQLRKKGLSVYSLPPASSKKTSKVSSKNSNNRKQINSDIYKEQNELNQQMSRTSVDISRKNVSTNRQSLNAHRENVQSFSHKAMDGGNSSKLYNHLSRNQSRCIEEDDDDLADFIDDGPIDEELDISSQIREIFKYDTNRYYDDDDDDDIVESSFCEQMKEECRSAKIGRQEDLEDMRKEEEERKRKLMKLKQKNAR